MSLHQWAFFAWMVGGFTASLSTVLWLAGRIPTGSVEERNELLALYLLPIILMYFYTRFFPPRAARPAEDDSSVS